MECKEKFRMKGREREDYEKRKGISKREKELKKKRVKSYNVCVLLNKLRIWNV